MKVLTSEEFYSTLSQNEYGKQYLELVDKVKSENRGITKEKGYERHHIHPVKLGGSNITDNIVKFTVFEHCIAHTLLAKALPDVFEAVWPITKMSGKQYKDCSDLEKITLDEVYEWSKIRDKALFSPRPKEIREKISKKGMGRHHSEESRQKMSKQNKERWLDPEYRKKMSEAHKGKPTGRKGIYHHSEETRKKISEAHKGKPAWNKGKVMKATRGIPRPKLLFRTPEGKEVWMNIQPVKRYHPDWVLVENLV